MYGDLGFYASELIHAINQLKDKECWETLISIIGAIGPVLIACIALYISFRSDKNSASVQEKIANSEDRALKRKIVVDAYSLFLNHDISYVVANGFLRVPSLAYNTNVQITSRRCQMRTAFNKVRLITMGDTSESARNLIVAIKNALTSYEQLDAKVTEFVGNGECSSVYNSAMIKIKSEYKEQFTEFEVFTNLEKRMKFFNYTNCNSIQRISELTAAYISLLSDEQFDFYFKQYLDDLSK